MVVKYFDPIFEKGWFTFKIYKFLILPIFFKYSALLSPIKIPIFGIIILRIKIMKNVTAVSTF